MRPKNFFSRVAQRSVTQIVQQRRAQHDRSIGQKLRGAQTQPIECPPRDRHHAQGMGKSRSFRPMKGETGRAKLSQPSKPLEGGSVDEMDEKIFGAIVFG